MPNGPLPAIDTESISQGIELLGDDSSWEKQPVRVSGVLITYNQEAFVRQALTSVLNQTYPMDVIVSDDCSTDRTNALIRATFDDYKGHHRIRLRSGQRNLGVCGNQNATIRLAEGELVVMFEGDDESLPERVEKLVNAYLTRFRRVGALGSAIQVIDGHGQAGALVSWPARTGDAWTALSGEWAVHGCGLAFRRDCFFEIGPIGKRLISGDIALWMRAAFVAAGGMLQVREPLVNYRIHGGNVSKGLTLDFTSPEALRACCSNLLKNEVAQVLELRKIDRYRRRVGLLNDGLTAAWKAHFKIAEARARFVFAVSRKSRLSWIWSSAAAVPHAQLRGRALRVMALAILPWARSWYRILQGSTDRHEQPTITS